MACDIWIIKNSIKVISILGKIYTTYRYLQFYFEDFINKVDDSSFNSFAEQIKETQQTIISIYLY